MRQLWRVCLALILFAATSLISPSAAGAQIGSTTDIITGTVLGPNEQPLANATVEVTSIESGITRTKTTNERGQYTLLFPDGGGQYRVVARFLGLTPQELMLARVADEDRLVADFTLRVRPTTLATVEVQARRQPRPRADERPTPGSTERTLSGEQLQRLPIDPSDPNAVALLAAGVVGIAGSDTSAAGFSVAGQRPDQNQVTLDGLTFESGTVPDEAIRSTRVVTNTYDVARGQFTGGLIQTTTRGGTNDVSGSFSYSLRDPHLEFADEDSGTLSQSITQHQLSGGVGGPLAENRAFYFVSAQLRRRLNPLQSLIGTDDLTLERLGTDPDSVEKFLDVIEQQGLPASVAAVPDDRLNDNISTVARLDYQLTENHSLMLRGNFQHSLQQGFRTSALTVPSYGGEQSGGGVGGMVMLSSVLGTMLNEVRASWSADDRQGDPYLLVPEGRVRVRSELEDGTRGVSTLSFGGNPGLPTSGENSQLEVTDELSLLSFSGHRYKLGVLFNYTRFNTASGADRSGSFLYNSLADFENGLPASYTRTLSPVEREGSAVNSAVYLGDTWRRSRALQITYGARLEYSAFLREPSYNPLVEQLFGRRTDEFPTELHLSPRIGFSWVLGRGDDTGAPEQGRGRGRRGRGGGAGFGGAGSNLTVIRGGVGEFRGRAPTQLFAAAIDATGLPGGERQLVCIGSAVPVPDWGAYLSDPASIPDRCADGAVGTPVVEESPTVALFSPDFGAPRAWRASLGVSRRLTALLGVSADVSYSYGTNLYGVRDLNLVESPRFTLGDEADRPVYVPASTIDESTGALSVLASRQHDELGRVLELNSSLHSRTTQMTLGVNGIARRALLWNLSYTLTRSRDQTGFAASGLGGGGGRGGFGVGASTTGGDPNAIEWGRSDLERRHGFTGSLSWFAKPWLDVTSIFRLSSGQPYTPRVGGDVNGDGARNDRAFIFDPAATADTAIANGMSRVLTSAPDEARECLLSQMGQIAGRNSCTSGWTPTFDLQFNLRPDFGGVVGRRLSIMVSLMNPLAGLDQLWHGNNALRGWGQPSRPDATLLHVRGFDEATQRFEYEVNERFGDTRSARTALRNPFQIGLRMRLQIGPDRQRALLLGAVRGAGRGGMSALNMRLLVERVSPDPIEPILALSDSLAITPAQDSSLRAVAKSLFAANDSMSVSLQAYVDSLGPSADLRTVFPRIQPRLQSARQAYLDAIAKAKAILTESQWKHVPETIRNPQLQRGRERGPGQNDRRGGGPPSE